MSQRPERDDESLGAFLRTHAPLVPPPAADLEERIVAAGRRGQSAAVPHPVVASGLPELLRPASFQRYLLLGLGASALAAAAATLALLTRKPAAPVTKVSDDSLAAFVVASWDDVAFQAADDGDSLSTALASLP